MRPGELIERIPSLQCGVSADQRPAFGTELVGDAKLVFGDAERFPEETRREELFRHLAAKVADAGTLAVESRQFPRLDWKSRMILILMVIDCVEVIANQR